MLFTQISYYTVTKRKEGGKFSFSLRKKYERKYENCVTPRPKIFPSNCFKDKSFSKSSP